MSNEEYQDESAEHSTECIAPEPIAIIGLGCRFPGAKDPSSFWQMVRDGVDAISEMPADRWDMDAYYDADPQSPGKINSRWCGHIGEVDKFDAHFFKISPREAVQVDPQQRLLMEVAWEALEDAGQVTEKLAGSNTGVFIGVMAHDYAFRTMSNPDLIDFYTVPGFVNCINANRLSYFFDFRGPSMAVDTACSSSLVAVHLACRSIWNGESTMALAGGVNIILSPEGSVWFSQGGLMASDGHCKAFDARADGLVRGEGAGIVVLKPLSKARDDGDPIYAVIRGSAVNQDGRSNGLTAPNRFAQEAVMRDAYALAGVSPGRVRYVEAHGTGTALGDPIEANALGSVLAAGRATDDLCAVGSVKTNIGHLEAAAGVASLIKVALILKHRLLPPSLHFENPNPLIPFEKLALRVQRELAPWPDEVGTTFAGINACGFGGTNAHVVLSEAPETAARPSATIGDDRAQLLTLSARTPDALAASARAFREYLSGDDAQEGQLASICHTTRARRTHHEHRLAVVGRSRGEFVERIKAFLQGEPLPSVSTGRKPASRAPKIVFVYPGQGSQWIGMGRQLLHAEAVFRESIERCAEEIEKQAAWSLIEQITSDEEHSRLDEINVLQPTLFAIQVALTALWRSWGVEPAAIVGQSMGEVAAAHVAGALSLEDAVRVICERSRLLRRLRGQGGMAALELSLEEAEAALAPYAGRLSVAVSNSPSSTVIAGEPSALEELVRKAQARDVFCRHIKVDVASHSPQVEPLREDLLAALRDVRSGRSAFPVCSTATGEFGTEINFDASYWWSNLREPVLFSAAIERLLDRGFDTFVEVSTHPIAISSIQQVLYHTGRAGRVLASLRREEDERSVMLGSLGSLYAAGQSLNWEGLAAGGEHVNGLPNYPWQRERFWHESESGDARRRESGRGATGRPLLGLHLQPAHPAISHLWELRLSRRSHRFLEDHCIQGVPVLPGTAYVEMVLEAAAEAYDVAGRLADLDFHNALFLPNEGARTVQLSFSPCAQGDVSFRIYSRPEGEPPGEHPWLLHATGMLRLEEDETKDDAPPPVSLSETAARCGEEKSGEDLYGLLERAGNGYGPSFRNIESLHRRDGEVVARLRVPPASAGEVKNYIVHPAILDNCLQSFGAAMPADADGAAPRGPCVPVGIERVHVGARGGAPLWIHATLRSATTGDDALKGDVSLLDEEGVVLVKLSGVRLQFLEESVTSDAPASAGWLYELAWQEDEHRQTPAEAGDETAQHDGTWLIFEDDGGVGAALARELEGRSESCLLVSAGEAFESSSAGRFRVNPMRREDIMHLLGTIPGGAAACRGVIHLWNLDAPSYDELTVESLDAAREKGCLSVVNLIRALAEDGSTNGARVWVVTQGAQAVECGAPEGSAAVELSQSAAWGLGRTIAQEQPALWGGLIDLDGKVEATEAAQQLSEAISATGGETQIAFRGGRRYVARLAQLQEAARPSRELRWRPDATYLITGGFGSLGLETARWMVEQGARRLVLMGRTRLPSRSKWALLTDDDPMAATVKAVRVLEAMGASVHLAAVDIAAESQLTSFLETFRREGWPAIRGVVHCAGLLDDRTLLEMDAETFGVPWRPKVAGAWLLHRLFADAPLDFFVLFSSATSLLGSPGQANYAAANSFLDSLAHLRRTEGLPALSINWGAWSEVGQAARAERGGRLARRGFESIGPTQGLEVLARLMGGASAQVGVLPINWPLVRSTLPELAASPFFSRLNSVEREAASPPGAEPVRHSLTRELLSASGPEQRYELLDAYVREIACRVLRISPLAFDAEKPLNTLGLDSLMAIELKNLLQTNVGVVLPLVNIMRGASAAQLVGQLLDRLNEQEAAEHTPAPASTGRTGETGAATPRAEADEMNEAGAAELLAGLNDLTPEQIDQLLASMLSEKND